MILDGYRISLKWRGRENWSIVGPILWFFDAKLEPWQPKMCKKKKKKKNPANDMRPYEGILQTFYQIE